MSSLASVPGFLSLYASLSSSISSLVFLVCFDFLLFTITYRLPAHLETFVYGTDFQCTDLGL